MQQRIWGVLVCVGTAAPTLADEDDVRQTIERTHAARIAAARQTVSQREIVVERAKAGKLSFGRDLSRADNLVIAERQLHDAKTRLIVVSGSLPEIPALDFERLKIHAWGAFPERVTVFQVIDDSSALVQYGELYWLTKTSTKGWVDGAAVKLPGSWKAKGTKTYTTALRTSRTVWVFAPFPAADEILRSVRKEFTERHQAEVAAANKAAAEEAAKDAAEKRLAVADGKLRLAKRYRKLGKPELAEKMLAELVDDYADTAAAVEAKALLAE